MGYVKFVGQIDNNDLDIDIQASDKIIYFNGSIENDDLNIELGDDLKIGKSIVIEFGKVLNIVDGDVGENCVKFIEQTLTASQQSIARNNISVYSKTEVTTKIDTEIGNINSLLSTI